MAAERVPISVVILTFNEESNLPGCLQSLHGWVDGLFIVDSGSTDATLDIAARFGARIVHHPFETHSRQWSWALENLPLSHEWVLGLDADQRATPELRSELVATFAGSGAGPVGVDGLFIARRQIFRGRWIRHGGYARKYLLKLFRRGAVVIDEADFMDHHFYVPGPTARLRGAIVEDNQKENDIAFWIEKHNRYAVLHAREEMVRGFSGGGWAVTPRLMGSPDERVVWLKTRWYRMPLFVRPALYFAYRYLVQLGFLDGKQGFIFHFLQAFWYRLLVDIHLDDMRRAEREPGAGAAPDAVPAEGEAAAGGFHGKRL